MKTIGRQLFPAFLVCCAAVHAQQPSGSVPQVIHFSGYDWIAKDSNGSKIGPGANYFSADAVVATGGRLKLKLVERDGRYSCAEVISQASLGYGTYRFTLASNIDGLATNLVLGLFIWHDDPEFSHRE